MKLRIQGNSLRLRISQSELAIFRDKGELHSTIFFGTGIGSELTYILARHAGRQSVGVSSEPGRVTVVLPAETAEDWASTNRVGIGGEIDLGTRGVLSILVEKDFACLDGSVDDNADAFPNPLAGQVCS